MIVIKHFDCNTAIYEVVGGPLQKDEQFSIDRLRPLNPDWPPYDPHKAPCPNCGKTLWFRWPQNVRQEES